MKEVKNLGETVCWASGFYLRKSLPLYWDEMNERDLNSYIEKYRLDLYSSQKPKAIFNDINVLARSAKRFFTKE